MLDKDVCEALGIDPFAQKIMKELDWAEEQLYDPNITPIRYIEIKARYDTLKELRDTYCSLITKNKQ